MAKRERDRQAVRRRPPHHVVLTREGQEAMGVQRAPLELSPDRWTAHAQASQRAAGSPAPAGREALARMLVDLCAQGAVLFSTWFLF
ncbi:MAG: hypothetical protein M3361_22470 [Candidatus Tectomicrobia bacterium]|nr:hypothetical protein [Candidatus Tectomicrobia bacterium]